MTQHLASDNCGGILLGEILFSHCSWCST